MTQSREGKAGRLVARAAETLFKCGLTGMAIALCAGVLFEYDWFALFKYSSATCVAMAVVLTWLEL